MSALEVPRQWRWLLPVVVAAAAAEWLASIAAGEAGGGRRILLMASGAVLTAVAVGLPLWQQARAARARTDAVGAARAARAAMRVTMEDTLDPFVALLRQLASASDADKPLLRGEAIQLALTTISHIAELGDSRAPRGDRRLRVCYFTLEEGPPRRLVPRAYAGRRGAPTTSFDETTRAGQFLLRIAEGDWVVVDDTNQLSTPIWWDHEQAYHTFAAGPVPGPGGNPVGLLVVDALAPGELATLDLPPVRLLTHLLALALQL